jgi:GNAT superfamily N-acetyltransferase
VSTHERTRIQDISFSTGHLDVVREQDVTSDQEHFINHWNQHYFGQVSVARGLKQAPVHWRLIWRDEKTLLSHVALTELGIELDGQPMRAGAIGGLFTPPHLQGRGYANALMEEAETFLFEHLKLPMGILFCLPELVPFYAKRHWTAVTQPVTLEQTSGSVTWSASVMILLRDRTQIAQSVIHVPLPSAPE